MTVTLPPKKHQETRLMLTEISWSQMADIEKTFTNIGGVRFLYLDGILEIMTISPEHEEIKSTIGALLEAYMRQKGIKYYIRGGFTLGNQAQMAKKEPDESYNFQTKKAIPDLVIEVIFTSGGIDILELYKRIGIPEVWLWQDGVLSIYDLKSEYEKVQKSQFLPELDINLLVQYNSHYDQYEAVSEFIEEIKKI